eukprot:1297444-Prymnesium_polylepis.1
MPQQRSSREASPARLHRKATLLYTMCTNYSRNEPSVRGMRSPVLPSWNLKNVTEMFYGIPVR